MTQGSWTAVMAAEDLGVHQQLLLRRMDAAAMLGMSIDSFERYVEPEIRLVLVGSMRRVPLAELRRWVDENSVFYGVAA